MKTVLIGKHGQLGTELHALLVAKKEKVYAFDHDELDIEDYHRVNTILTKLRPNIVINTSAYHVLSACENYPEKAFAFNAFALKNLARLCGKLRASLVTYSTDYVFDGTKGTSYTEDDRPNPIQIYGLSKLAGEFICLNYYPEHSVVIRTCGVYGGATGSKQKKGNFVLMILDAARRSEKLDVASEQIVSPTYAVDLAQATLKLLSTNSPRGIYHVVNEGFCSWYEFAREIVSIARLPAAVRPINRNGVYSGIQRPLFSALKSTRLQSAGIRMPSRKDALQRYLAALTT